MSLPPGSGSRLIGSAVVTIAGVIFFFGIIGVFGLPLSIVSLALFIALAIAVFRRRQTEGVPR